MHRNGMLKALEQAWLGRGSCSPNPGVGAVAVRDGNIVARAWHQGAGNPHAEQVVLQQLAKNARGVTLYVTLEPCNHWGRTPPCVDAIIKAGVSTVVYGFHDPNPVVAANDTPSLLRAHGIEVIHYPMDEIDCFYQSYAHWINTGKPWVTAKMAQSLDGKIAGVDGRPVALSNPSCGEFTHKQRLHTDVIVTTAQTVIRDNPRLNVRLGDTQRGKPLAIIDRTLKLPENAAVLETASHCHIYHDEQYPVVKPLARCRYHPVPSRHGRLDLDFIITHLGRLGFHDVWVEAGGRLFSALHDDGLVNRTFLYIVPELLGEMATSGYHGDQIFKRNHTVSWHARQNNMILRLDWLEDGCLPD
ncbi:bifunctional diaminohydroxyphosphoribosylaminopyrimidine deaminase/5-amino-6-(5-phosphoribosylamino)uracil reductase RibD [Legionella spiritensis]|uniref:Riboflavin biosynthesis protein RibD n=1 Tax=Legionella spiritensis TaxID=452 RepID=A0A0W0Z6U4_LEGSP|nr:bifunctional diaminohydroxyphosphoribosylaminopyrimidine deaminase/5-amino-6-(5-phosphoribosylamino)uracil reductase RibD [Legionella spiritensis]KTD64837.1 riboflavin biosynthesis protein RibD [Legionella spiritensis]SNV40462.1 riboflavin biosynthesis protein [Legionella spiritensis]